MKTLEDFLRQFDGLSTSLQQLECTRELEGVQVRVVGDILDIHPDYIDIVDITPRAPAIGMGLYVKYDERHKHYLVNYSSGEQVELTVRFGFDPELAAATDFDSALQHSFSLVAIRRLKTLQQRAEEKAAAAKKRERGCFVATATYGSHSKAVETLEEFRDRALVRFALGRVLTRVYYAVSPALAEVIAASPRRRHIARVILAPFVLAAGRCVKIARRRSA